MEANTINASTLAKMFLAGAKNLESKKEWINELNVFPVPDGDTGTNKSCQHFIMGAIRATCFIYCPALNGCFPLVTFLASPNHFLMRTNRNLCRFYLILFRPLLYQ